MLVSRWGLAGMLGVTTAVTLALQDPFSGLPRALVALLCIMSGWFVMLIFSPWGHMFALERRRVAVAQLTRDVRRAADRREAPMPEFTQLPDGDLAALARALQETIVHAETHRRESLRLQRTMDDRIRRETDRATHRLKREAVTDPLTGLGNRRAMEAKLRELFGPDRRRHDENIVAMLLDIDLFKPINDVLGHQVGDECLTFLGKLLSSTLRREDCAIRLGGDEFAVLMPNQTVEESRAVAERFRALFGQMPWMHGTVPRPTISIGVASAQCADPAGPEQLLLRADSALYRAKAAGRNTVRMCAEPKKDRDAERARAADEALREGV